MRKVSACIVAVRGQGSGVSGLGFRVEGLGSSV